MTLTWSRRHTLIAGVALIAVTNAVALGGVAWNRSGTPESELKLTQRELWEPYRGRFDRDSGGFDLSLRWRALTADPGTTLYVSFYGSPEWLDLAKVGELGFDVSKERDPARASTGYAQRLSREALIVLELDGPATRTALQRVRERADKEAAKVAAGAAKSGPGSPAQQAADNLRTEQTSSSRLFAVDAGLDAAALRAKYPDRTRYAILRGRIRAEFYGLRAGDLKARGYIEGLYGTRITLPLEYRQAFEAVPRPVPPPGVLEAGPPFQVTIAFGKRFEPWVTAVTATR